MTATCVAESTETLFGLPAEVKFCRKCCISNMRPSSCIEFLHTRHSKKETIAFDDEGVCSACRVAEAKESIDWNARREQLAALCDEYRSKDGSYDCLIPSSGGKDSMLQAWTMKHEFGMHPLTVTWAPGYPTPWGRDNLRAMIHTIGVDNFYFTPNGKVHRLLTRLAVQELLHPFQSFIFGQASFGPRLAARFGIPLVVYGESTSEYGTARDESESPVRKAQYHASKDRDLFHLGGTSLRDLREKFGLSDGDIDPYLPANPADLNGVKTIHLGYFKRWGPQKAYYFASEHCGFRPAPERTPCSYQKYNSQDDGLDDYHYATTYIKFGIGRATYDASQEIRNGELTREEGVALIKKYDHEWPTRFEQQFYDYISIPDYEYPIASKQFEEPVMTRDSFFRLADRFRSPHLWEFVPHKRHGFGEAPPVATAGNLTATGTWRLKHAVWHE